VQISADTYGVKRDSGFALIEADISAPWGLGIMVQMICVLAVKGCIVEEEFRVVL
jgi:hypothetical protein